MTIQQQPKGKESCCPDNRTYYYSCNCAFRQCIRGWLNYDGGHRSWGSCGSTDSRVDIRTARRSRSRSWSSLCLVLANSEICCWYVTEEVTLAPPLTVTVSTTPFWTIKVIVPVCNYHQTPFSLQPMTYRPRINRAPSHKYNRFLKSLPLYKDAYIPDDDTCGYRLHCDSRINLSEYSSLHRRSIRSQSERDCLSGTNTVGSAEIEPWIQGADSVGTWDVGHRLEDCHDCRWVGYDVRGTCPSWSDVLQRISTRTRTIGCMWNIGIGPFAWNRKLAARDFGLDMVGKIGLRIDSIGRMAFLTSWMGLA